MGSQLLLSVISTALYEAGLSGLPPMVVSRDSVTRRAASSMAAIGGEAAKAEANGRIALVNAESYGA